MAEEYRPLPKVQLHCHILGAVPRDTVIALARKNGTRLADADPADIYLYHDFAGLVEILVNVAEVMREPEDFSRVAFEVLRSGFEHDSIIYSELFFQPMYHALMDVPYDLVVEGLLNGIGRAERELGVQARLIAGINRQLPGAMAVQLVEKIIRNGSEYVAGIGLEDYEPYGPPEQFVEAFALARRHGLHRTAHAGEHGGPENVVTCVGALRCERIDHGYHLVEDRAALYRLAGRDVHFTVCPTVCNRQGWYEPEDHVLRQMYEIGLRLSVNTDDPAIIGTDLSTEYAIAAELMGLQPADMLRLSREAIADCWLDDGAKAALTDRFDVAAERFSALLVGDGGRDGDGQPAVLDDPR
ncbi:MAG: hypothetical protein V7607_4491 [Solirubrobacteraceae bacterium]